MRALFILYSLTWLASLYGWIANIVSLFGLWAEPINGEFVLRLVGVPLFFIGAIAGYF